MIWTCPEGHSVLESPQRVCPWCEIERLRVGHERYETVRRMNAQQFEKAYVLSIHAEKPFDDSVDELKPILRPRGE